jgi:hypothetical protein
VQGYVYDESASLGAAVGFYCALQEFYPIGNIFQSMSFSIWYWVESFPVVLKQYAQFIVFFYNIDIYFGCASMFVAVVEQFCQDSVDDRLT